VSVAEAQPFKPPSRGEEVELTIDSLAYGGEGVGRVGESGYVVFVAGAVEGDRVRAQIYKRRPTHAHARLVELCAPSPIRVPPLADHPGAPWQVLPYPRQLEVKQAQVREALERLGDLHGFRLEPIVAAEQLWRYRNKLEFSFGYDRDGRAALGFHAPARWNRVVEVEDCLLASERVNAALAAVRGWMEGQPNLPWERNASRRGERSAGPDQRGLARLRNLVVREGRRTGELLVRLVVTPGRVATEGLVERLRAELGEGLVGVLVTELEALGETTQGGTTTVVWGGEAVRERLCGLEVEIPYEAFFQTNTEMAERLYALAKELAEPPPAGLLYDLYCGLGLIGLVVGGPQARIEGIELSPAAVEGARTAAAAAGASQARFQVGEVAKLLPGLLAERGAPQLAVVDPPRAGLGRRACEALIDCGAQRILYISCNPTTLAGDGARLAGAGYRLERVRAVDMFPQTHHIECVAVFGRDG